MIYFHYSKLRIISKKLRNKDLPKNLMRLNMKFN
jgi:hypothetical protein